MFDQEVRRTGLGLRSQTSTSQWPVGHTRQREVVIEFAHLLHALCAMSGFNANGVCLPEQY